MISLVGLIGPLTTLADKLGLFQVVKIRLFNQPGPAAEALAVTLGEISKIYSSIEAELVRYTGLWFDVAGPSRDNQQEQAVLLMLNEGAMRARMEETRGHCSKIYSIYEKHLEGWFSNALAADEAIEMQRLFHELHDTDDVMLDAIAGLSTWLTQEAKKTSALVDNGQYAEANEQIHSARIAILPYLDRIASSVADLRHLQAEIIKR